MSMTKTTEKKMYTWKSCDGKLFEVDESVAMMSVIMKEKIEAGCSDNTFPCPDVYGRIVEMVIQYCQKHVDSKEDLKEWDEAFIDVDQETHFEIILAAFFLEIKDLFDLACNKLWRS